MRIVAAPYLPVSGSPSFAILAAVEVYVQYQTDAPVYYSGRSSTDDVKAQGYSTSMEHWHGFETARSVIQIHETTIVDSESDLSAHLVTVPARSLGGDSYLFRGTDWPLETLGLVRLADVPLGGVAAAWPRVWYQRMSKSSCEGSTKASKKRPVTPVRSYPGTSCSPSTLHLPGLSRSSGLRSPPILWVTYSRLKATAKQVTCTTKERETPCWASRYRPGW